MIGKKIGTYTEIFTAESQVNGYAIKAIFEKDEMQGGGSTKLTEKNVKETIHFIMPSDINAITIQYEQGKLVVNFSVYETGKEVGIMSTKATFAIDLETQDVYNSQY